MKWASYLKLMRFHKPVGFFLLWFPTAWALWIANAGNPPLILVVLFFLGTLIMRAAGCIINDIADRHIDCHVKRTAMRPLTSGQLNLFECFFLFLILLSSALFVLMQLPQACITYAILAVFITILYPFCKRFTHGPQLILGIAFSMGIPMAFAATGVHPNTIMILLLVINALWVIAYDTQYAMVDREEDLLIGVKSTAIFFAQYDRIIIAIMQIIFHFLWLVLAFKLNYSYSFGVGWFTASWILVYQQKQMFHRQPVHCFKAFSANIWYGALMWISILAA